MTRITPPKRLFVLVRQRRLRYLCEDAFRPAHGQNLMNRRHMKYTLSFLLFLLAAATVTVPAAGQHADARIGALLNSGDYFTLREVLPRQADSIASPVVPRDGRNTGRHLLQPAGRCPRSRIGTVGDIRRRTRARQCDEHGLHGPARPLHARPVRAAAARLTDDFIADTGGSLPDELLFSLEFFRRTGHAWPDVRPRSSSCPKAAPAYPTGSAGVGRGRIMTCRYTSGATSAISSSIRAQHNSASSPKGSPARTEYG